MKTEDYIPFGKEWQKAMNRSSKKVLIEFLKKQCEKRQAIEHQNKELILCLENSTKIMEDQEGEVMDLIICDTMNHQIRWNRETLETNKK